MVARKKERLADRVGFMGGLLCLVHCLAFPLLAAGISLGELGWLHSHDHGTADWLWHSLDYVFVALGVAAVFFAARQTPFRPVRVGLVVSVTVFSVATVFEALLPALFYVGMVAAISLITFHAANLWLLRRKPACA